MQRAYSVLNVKSLDDGNRILRGWATTPEPDRVGDVVEPLGVKFKNPLPLLLHHDSRLPVGTVKFEKPTKQGVQFEAQIAKVDEPGTLKDRVDEAWQSVKAGLIPAVSIGFRAVGDSIERIKDGGLRFLSTEVMELSLVVIPANAGAVITQVKSIDRKTLAALGTPGSHSSGVADTPGKPKVKTLQEKIAELESVKSQHEAAMNLVTEKALSGEGDLADDDSAEIDGHVEAIKKLEKSIGTLRAMESINLKGAQSVTKQVGSRGPTIYVPKSDPEDKFQGQSFTRTVIAKALSAQTYGAYSPAQIAEQRWGKSNPKLVEFLKAAVPGGGTGSGEWGAELVTMDGRYQGDFIEFLNNLTVFNRLPLREIPANVTIKGQDGAATGYWVGESKAIPMSKPDFMNVNMTPLKAAALSVISKELMRDSSPSAEMLVRDALAEAVAQKIDATFLSTAAAVSGVAPAGILNGLTPIASTGVSPENVRQDIAALYAPFITAKNSSGLYLVTTPALAKTISLMRNPLGQREFPEVGGGNLDGDPVVMGDNVPAGYVIAIKPSDIYKIGDGGIEVEMSMDATIEQDSAPTGASDTPAAATANMVNMFQSHSVAIKVVRSMNFAKRRASAVAFINDAAYSVATV